MPPIRDSEALKIAEHITIAKVSGSTSSALKQTGEETADYFEEVYNRVSKIIKSINQQGR